MAALVGLATVVSFLLSPATVQAVPSPQSIGSDLTILTNNDLSGNASVTQAATIVLSARQSHSKAQNSCAALGETLWIPGNNTKDLGFFRYLDYLNTTDAIPKYWIGIGSTSGCSAITADGRTAPEPCDTRLPALCSQSAPLSSVGNVDTDTKWQTSVTTGNTTIVGYRDKLSFRFLGLNYASQPARFGYSMYEPPSSSANVSALSYGSMCMQAGCGGDLGPCSEDCLLLNIWTPQLPSGKTVPAQKKAVMLWIHGGGFTGGTGSDTTFDGGNMASRGDVVVVTINYRLSTLGFLALDNTTLRGNYWLSDQIAALDWVQNHIEDFGGDKSRVTVFGQSAGAASVRALLASPLAKGKFSRAIMQSCPQGSGYASTFSHYSTIGEATDLTKAILTETGCAQADKSVQLACLRAQDPITLVGGRNGQWTGTIARYPVVDGTYLSSDELPLDGSAPAKDVVVMTGIMRDDGDPFSSFSTSLNASQALTEQGYDAADILGSNQFPVPKGSNTTLDIFNLTARVATDAEFRCLTQSTAYSAAKNSAFPRVYSYEIDRGYQISEWSPNPPTCEAPVTPGHPYGDPSQPYFRCHSGELYYVFGNVIRQGRPPRDKDDVPFSQFMVDSWTAFGRTADPNPGLGFLRARGFDNTHDTVEKSSAWKPVEAGDPKLRVLDVEPKNEGFREMEQCMVLDYPLNYYSQ